MHKFLIANINKQAIEIDRLEVQSFEMNVYLVKLEVNGNTGFVYDANDKPMRFHSSQQVRDVFEQCTVHSAFMVHDSPYDEMIGNPNKAEQAMAMPFSMAQPY